MNMSSNRKIGRLAGVCLLVMVGSGIPGVLFRNIGSAYLKNPELLQSLVENSMEIRLSIFLSFVAGISGVLFSIVIHQFIKPYSSFAAKVILTLSIVHISVSFVGDIFHYTLLESVHFTEKSDGIDILPIASLSIYGYFGAHFISLIIYSGTFVFMHSQFLRFRLLPIWFASWGMIAAGLVFIATWLQVFDQSVSFHFYNQNGLFMIAFTIYMLIMGFKEKE